MYKTSKKISVVFLLAVLCLGVGAAARSPVGAGPPEPELSASCAILMDAASGQVLYEKNSAERVPVASTTKIMTALLLLEAGEPERAFTATSEMVTVEGSSMGLRPGDLVSRYALACGMLLCSGNDAANTAAIHLDGSIPAFAARMNARAAALGMRGTHFVTPSGLDAEGHVSTAHDMALLGRAALQNQLFREICGQSSIRVSFGNPPYPRSLRNHNRLLYMLEGTVGIKTGFTKKSGRCLVSAVRREGLTLIAVTLRASDDWNDHKKLYNYGFAKYRAVFLDELGSAFQVPVAGGSAPAASLRLAWQPQAYVTESPGELRREILLRPFEYAPLPKGRVLGAARYYAGDVLLAEVPLVVSATVERRTVEAKPKREGFWAGLKRRLGF
ncbi:MAG: D-alanyl-D-alanine carboxypeptidase [Oscillospiraceae bacterium]|nr:D-alanyl-D-alanine carboxypeptidase [Oscillospiraceae bacterium]